MNSVLFKAILMDIIGTKRFAIFPKKVTSGRWVWLKTYYIVEMRFDPSTGRPPLNSTHYTFTETAAERTWRLLKC